MSRIKTVFAQLQQRGRKALIPYITAGDPDPGTTVPLMHAMVAAGAVVTPRKIVRSGELWAGNPAQKLRDITEKDLEMFRRVVGHYLELANAHRPVERKAAE